MKIALTGGTGFIGQKLTDQLLQKNHQVYILTRNKEKKQEKQGLHFVQWLNEGDEPEEMLEGIDVLINLAGESINSGRWTEERKRRIYHSRMHATNEVIRLINYLNEKPYTLINASAVGYYGTSEKRTFDEASPYSGEDFLSTVVKNWEDIAKTAEKDWNIRTVCCRFGIILDKNAGALPKMALPYKLYAGGRIGSGNQWLSWIHINDVISAIVYMIEHESIEGPVNFTAPNPVTMNEFGHILSSVLHKPHWLPVPSFAVRAILGEMSMLVTEGQKVTPKKLLSHDYPFHFTHLKEALEDIYQK
ncbi:TIGR01777 family oxidoreductase [Cytobacillus kochii]|uniref:TIGR01777 family oxidoreductase n=1 Tax=Cytobacillus kochii TaxID=859143 RepID=UPI00203EE963|nr:TIGR01777 family oxidoreductase [Cytobacillus kochii]MCM3324163.1 TIGR01777 family oxidoreductase [Cytobacillus kochii]MCM3346434.1 TIGR01777 family oxidoreductase [Cytobacillus kochii]